ncbi:protein FAR1-RELATED SEQUENCE 5-like [Chenopodium quinoa]|uniref:protein FAR1-RELATED SEQUENCE 5-like n=1 Tax=Chenopodium quinoa TaxID=63459 RepID=UPI000B76DE23|nr:protein FAR1-RELATED SEQUENCE 5-like [Chenopodium quinoa]
MEIIEILDEINQAKQSELYLKQVTCDAEAYDLYNDYAFKFGFSIRRAKVRKVGQTSVWRSRKYFCSNAGLKDHSKSDVRRFEKLDVRTDCKAYVEFIIDDKGIWTVTKHFMEHNHAMIPLDKRHLLRSQRKVNQQQLKFISNMKASGVRVTDSIRAISKEVGGSPNLGCTKKYVYNALGSEKFNRIEGLDCNQFIKYLAQRQAKESDFFYEFEVDEHNALCSVFWRDGRMKRGYEFFGDLMVFDTTYRTNKYGMICAPFVGMNHHCNNVMFGMGFVLDEKIPLCFSSNQSLN